MSKTKQFATIETKDYRVYKLLDRARLFCILVILYAALALISTIKNAIGGDLNGTNLAISIVLIGVFSALYIVIGYVQGVRLLTRKWTVKVRLFTLIIDCVRPCWKDEAVFLMAYRCPMEEIECVDQLRPGFTTIWRRTERGAVRILTTCPADIIMLALKEATPSGNTQGVWTSPPDKEENSE